MANSLVEFLMENPVDNLTEQVTVSERLKDYPFTIRAMTGPEFQNYQNIATAIGKKNKIRFDSKKYNELVILNHVVTPDFKNAETLRTAGFQRPEDFLYKSLLAGEIAELASKISDLSGFEREEEEAAEEAKND